MFPSTCDRLTSCITSRFILIFIVMMLTVSHQVTSSTASGSVHVWRGKIIYYGGSKEMPLQEAMSTCNNLGGQLPSVHSHQDIAELIHVIGQEARLWLGAKPKNTLSPNNRDTMYEWLDGTPFDYTRGWVRGYPSCHDLCCGVGFTTVYEDGLVDKECSIHRRLICMLPVMTNETAKAWLSSQLEELSSHFNESNALDFEQQLALEILNETLYNMQVNTDIIMANLSNLETSLRQQLNNLNASVMMNEQHLSELFVDVKSSVSLKAHEASLKTQQNETELSSLSTRINICFVLLSFIVIVLLVTIMIKSNILSWVPSLRQSNIYTRFREPRMSHLSATSVNNFSNPAHDSNLNLDSYYCTPTEPQDRV